MMARSNRTGADRRAYSTLKTSQPETDDISQVRKISSMPSSFKGTMTSRPWQKTIDLYEMPRKYVAEAEQAPQADYYIVGDQFRGHSQGTLTVGRGITTKR
ncbi:hypothetical protein Trydic_g16111 [Trypoxylus dichotomus]